jgi:hypothetical protein
MKIAMNASRLLPQANPSVVYLSYVSRAAYKLWGTERTYRLGAIKGSANPNRLRRTMTAAMALAAKSWYVSMR